MSGVGGELLVIQFLDVSRAYPHAQVLRDDFYVETVDLPEDTCLLARRGWYGMRDAGQAFEFAVRDHFLDHGFKQEYSVHASSPIVVNSHFVHGMVTSGLECVATWKVTRQNCLNGSSSRIEESWVPTACMRYEF